MKAKSRAGHMSRAITTSISQFNSVLWPGSHSRIRRAGQMHTTIPDRNAFAAHVRRALLGLAVLLASAAFGHADDDTPVKPKFGPDAITIQQSHYYFRAHDAPDYWALSPYYVPQLTGSGCTVASIATLMNVVLGLPPLGSDKLVTQESLLAKVGSQDWVDKSGQGGDGLTFEEFKTYVMLSLEAYGVKADVEIFKPEDTTDATLARLRTLLTENESTDDDIVLTYFNQGVVTGDWDGPHVSPLGAYDSENRRVLIMDVDRQFYIPYWTTDEKLLEAMLRPSPADQGALAGETGGLVRVTVYRGAAREDARTGMPDARSRIPQ